MRNSLTEVVVVVVSVLLVVMAAARGARQEKGLPLTAVDFQHLGQFLGELTHSLYANTAALCLLQDQGEFVSVHRGLGGQQGSEHSLNHFASRRSGLRGSNLNVEVLQP